MAKRYPPLAEGERIMPAFAKIALVVAFVSAIVWLVTTVIRIIMTTRHYTMQVGNPQHFGTI